VLSDITVPIGKLPKKENLDKMQLSEREREIVSLLFQGMDVNEISSKLYISSNTVRNHLYNIYKKNGIRNRMQLMKKLM
jgi:LuxR family transcriptional regulator of csgAB operon